MSIPENYESMEEWAAEREARANRAEDRVNELENIIGCCPKLFISVVRALDGSIESIITEYKEGK